MADRTGRPTLRDRIAAHMIVHTSEEAAYHIADLAIRDVADWFHEVEQAAPRGLLGFMVRVTANAAWKSLLRAGGLPGVVRDG